MKTVFISKAAIPNGPLHSFCKENNLRLIDKSLLAFKGVCPEEKPVKTDVIFFTSPRSVQFYFKYFNLRQPALATVGDATAKELEKHKLSAHFIGQTASNPKQVAKEFKTWLGNKTVLFPQSQRSNRTMQSELNPDQYIDLVVYETHLETKKLEHSPNYLVFTSPSNAEAYLLSNEITNEQVVLSFGTTTSKYLDDLGVKNHCLNEPTEEAVVLEMKNESE
jgi:uroporphyrinogen-III synthase